MPILAKLREFLDANKAAYSVHSHPTAYTAQEIAALSHVKGRALAKVVMVKAGADLAMVVLPADHKVDLGRLKRTLGAKDVRLGQEGGFSGVFPRCEGGGIA